LTGTLAYSPAVVSAAPPASNATLSSPGDTFRSLCLANRANLESVVGAARTQGFTDATQPPALPEGFDKVVALERGIGAAKQVLIVALGNSIVSNALSVKAPAHSCGVTLASVDWDVREFAKEVVGIAPQFDNEGTSLFSYFERAGANTEASDDDLPSFVAGLSAGELRSLAAVERNGMRSLSLGVFDAPSPPAEVPKRVAVASHDADPFSPCRWEGKTGARRLSCPDKAGKFSSIAARGLTEATPAGAAAGDISAMLRLSAFYAQGPSAAHDAATAFAWSKRAADAGSPDAAFNVGLAYDEGIGVKVDKAEATRWYRVGIDRGNLPAMVNLAGLLLAHDSTDVTAAPLLRRAADAGSIDGLFDMGYVSEHGFGVPQNVAEALNWYRQDADHKDARGALRLGAIYANGIEGVQRSDVDAVRWFVTGETPVARLITTLSTLEASVLRYDDKTRRAEIERSAASQPKLALSLGYYLADQNNKARDPVAALTLLRLAADAHIPAAGTRIGMMYAEGDGVEKNETEALRWFQMDPRIREAGGFQRTTKFIEPSIP
jgi:TPR repeat protein